MLTKPIIQEPPITKYLSVYFERSTDEKYPTEWLYNDFISQGGSLDYSQFIYLLRNLELEPVDGYVNLLKVKKYTYISRSPGRI